MRKYFEVGLITLKAQVVYRLDLFVKVILSFLRIFLAFIMWKVIFSTKSEIAGFTFSTMVTYYIVNAFFTRLDMSNDIVWQLSGEIKDGQFSKYLVKPIKPLGYFLASSFSKTIFTFGISFISTAFCIAIFRDYFAVPHSFMNVIIAIILGMLGLSFLALMNYFVGILSFKFLDVGGFNMIKNNFVQFLTGSLIPLTLLPHWVQGIMRLFPFYYINYYPAMIYLNREMDRTAGAIIVLLIWNFIMLFIDIFAYKKLRKSYEGVGI